MKSTKRKTRPKNSELISVATPDAATAAVIAAAAKLVGHYSVMSDYERERIVSTGYGMELFMRLARLDGAMRRREEIFGKRGA